METNQVAVAGRKPVTKNIVTAILSQNLSWVDKLGVNKTFNETQEFSSDTLTEITSEKVGLWLVCVLRQFVKLARLQNKTGFKLSKPIELKLIVNGRTLHVKSMSMETVTFKFSLSFKRIENLLVKYPDLVKTAFSPVPGIGGITSTAVRQYADGGKSLVLAPAKKIKEISAPEVIEIEGVVLDGVANVGSN